MVRIRESDGTNDAHLESANSANGPQCDAEIGCLESEYFMQALSIIWRPFDRFYPNVGVKMARLMQVLGLYLLGCISSMHASQDCATISRSDLNSQYPVSQINPQIVRERERDRSGVDQMEMDLIFDACFSTISELSAVAESTVTGKVGKPRYD